MQQNLTRMSPRRYDNDYSDETLTRNAQRARKRRVNREHRGDRRRTSIMLRRVLSVRDNPDQL